MPLHIQQIHWVHSSVIGTMTHSMFKSFNREFGNKIQMGCTLDNAEHAYSRLDELYKMPTPEIAQARLFQKYQSFLEAWMTYQETFVLQPRPPNPQPLQPLQQQEEG